MEVSSRSKLICIRLWHHYFSLTVVYSVQIQYSRVISGFVKAFLSFNSTERCQICSRFLLQSLSELFSNVISHSFSFCEFLCILSNCHFSFALDYHKNLYFELTTPMLILLLYILRQRDYIYRVTEHCCSSPVWRESLILFWSDTSQIRSSKAS